MDGLERGEVKFYIDGDKDFPTLNGTGTEDYFGGTYGFPGNLYHAIRRKRS